MGMARHEPLLLCHRSLCGGLRNTSATSCTCHSCRIQIRGSKCQEDTTESDRSGELRQPPRRAMQVVPSGSRLQESQRPASFSFSSSSPSATSRRPSVVCSRSHQRYTRVCIRRVVVYWNTSLIYSIPYPWFISIPYSIRPLGKDLKSGRPYIQNHLLYVPKDQRPLYFQDAPWSEFCSNGKLNLPHFGRYSLQTLQSIFCIWKPVSSCWLCSP
jgi:hypothetical protein